MPAQWRHLQCRRSYTLAVFQRVHWRYNRVALPRCRCSRQQIFPEGCLSRVPVHHSEVRYVQAPSLLADKECLSWILYQGQNIVNTDMIAATAQPQGQTYCMV